jgi:general stress protein YciG
MSDHDDTNGAEQKLTGRQKSGKAGGEATKEKHGSDFFRKIGKKGGESKGADEAPPA